MSVKDYSIHRGLYICCIGERAITSKVTEKELEPLKNVQKNSLNKESYALIFSEVEKKGMKSEYKQWTDAVL